MKKILIAIFMIAFYLPVSLYAQDSSQKESKKIIDKIIEAYGGQDVSSVSTYRLEANITAHASKKSGTVIRVSEGPSRLKVLIDYSTDKEIRIFKDNEVFRGPSFHKLVPVKGPMKTSVILQAARAFLPWILIKKKDSIFFEKKDNNFLILKISTGEGMILRIFVDAKTYFILQTEASMEMGQNVLVFKTEYSDFRRIEGVQFPFKEENYATGIHTATTKIKSVQFNPSKELLELIPQH